MTIECTSEKHWKKIINFITCNIEKHIVTYQCKDVDQRRAIVGPSGRHIEQVKKRRRVRYIWENEEQKGTFHIWDQSIDSSQKAKQCMMQRAHNTRVLKLPAFGQYGLLLADQAHLLNIIRDNSACFIVSLSDRPSEIAQCAMSKCRSRMELSHDDKTMMMNDGDDDGGGGDKSNDEVLEQLVRYELEQNSKCRLLVSGDNVKLTENAMQMIYEFLEVSSIVHNILVTAVYTLH